MNLGKEILGAAGDPLHRPAQQLRRKHHHDVFRIDEVLRPEAAAHVRHDHAHLLRRTLEDRRRHLAFLRVHRLAGHVQDHLVLFGVIIAEAAARLDCRRRHPVVDEGQRGHVRRPRNGLVRRRLVTLVEMVGPVRLDRGVDQLGLLVEHRGKVNHGRQVLVIDLDGLGRRLRLSLRFSDHHGHRIADEPSHVVGECEPLRHRHAILVQPVDGRYRRERPEACLLHVLAGQHL